MTAELVELRCPVEYPRRDGTCHPGHLLARLRRTGARESYVHPDNLIEMACPECKRRLAQAGRPVRRVLHRYDFAGQLAETLVEELPPGM